MRDGRPHGKGHYVERHGLYYEGRWHEGQMHGAGYLKLASGDEYTGSFQYGKAHGRGRFVDITGEIYEGQFARGRKHGTGKTTLPGGRSYSSIWVDGVETPNSQRTRYAQRGTVLAGRKDDVRLGITVERRLPQRYLDDSRRSDDRPGDRDLWYSASNRRNAVVIQPASRRFMRLWKGDGPIHILPDEYYSELDKFGVFSLGRGQLVPLEIMLHVQNRSSSRISLRGGYVEVERSELDAQPAVQLSSVTAFTDKNNVPEDLVTKGFFVENFGWGPAVDVNIRYGYYNLGKTSIRSRMTESRLIKRLKRSEKVDLLPVLVRAGMLRRMLDKQEWRCRTSTTEAGCLREARRTGVLGRLGEYVNASDRFLGLGVHGEVSYRWKTSSGEWRRRTSPFKHEVVIAAIEGIKYELAEEGEGGARTVITKKELRFEVGRSGYRLPFSFRRNVSPGATRRFVIRVGARKASQHRFRIVLRSSTGRLIRSRPIELTYFWPRWIRKSPDF